MPGRIGVRVMSLVAAIGAAAAPTASAREGKPATRPEAEQALKKAVRFFHTKVARHGGYLWQYSGDLKLREAEGKGPAYDSRIWVQPPGTPTVGEAFLDAYEATRDKAALQAAKDAGDALIKGQHRSGGWDYYVTFDPADKQPVRTCLDDDTTQAALRFLMRLDKALAFKDETVHGAVTTGLGALVKAQYPNGGWFVLWRRPPRPASAEDFPVVKATYPEKWPRTAEARAHTKIAYVLNDNLVPDVIRTLLAAADVYREDRYLKAAKKGGDFLVLAQMPGPQPAWAQQYDVKMQPVWGRKFEPPAISGEESQGVLESLLLLYRVTGDKKYLEPVPPALAYLKKSRLADGRLARFYELKTNKPLYFTRKYELTYKADDLPTHYGFLRASRLGAIEAEYRRLLAAPADRRAERPKPDAKRLAARARAVIDGLDGRGAWVEKGQLRFHRVEPSSGVINCRTFADNVRVLSEYIAAGR